MVDRRKKAYRDIISEMPVPSRAITETLDGRDFKYQPERRCRVCSAAEPRKALPNGADVRALVDDLILYPKDLLGIFRTIEPLMADWPPQYRISYKSIRTHQKKHLPWDAAAYRLMVERWAADKGVSLIDAAGRMVLTEEAFLEATAHKGWERLIKGDIEPSWVETQKAFERIAAIQSEAVGELDPIALQAQLSSIIEVVREFIPEDRWPQVITRLQQREMPQLPAKPPDDSDEVDPGSEQQARELFNQLMESDDDDGN